MTYSDDVAAIYAAGCTVSQNRRNGETTKWRRKALLRRSVPIRLPIGRIDGRGLDLKSSDWLILHRIDAHFPPSATEAETEGMIDDVVALYGAGVVYRAVFRRRFWLSR